MYFCLLAVTSTRFEFGFAEETQLIVLRSQLCFCLSIFYNYYQNIAMASGSAPSG